MFYQDDHATIYHGDCRRMAELPDNSVQVCVTSPPFWSKRKYAGEQDLIWGGQADCHHKWGSREFKQHSGRGDAQKSGKYSGQEAIPDILLSDSTCSRCGAWRGSLGLEPTPESYIDHLVDVFREVKRVLRKDGLCWINIGDTAGGSNNGSNDYRPEGASLSKSDAKYQGQKARLSNGIKCLDKVGIPEMLALALRADGWYWRSTIIWHKPSCMPESLNGWRFTRHRVTIKEYERLQSLRATKSRDKSKGRNMPGLPSETGEVSLQPQREREEKDPCSLSEAQESTPKETFDARGADSSQTSEREKALSETRTQRETKAISPTLSPDRKGQSDDSPQAKERALEEIPSRLLSHPERTSVIHEESSLEAECDCDNRPSLDSNAMVRGTESQSLPLLLLQAEGEINDRPCDTSEQGGNSHKRECSASLPEVQLVKKGQNCKTLVDCPGCPKCAPNDGLVLRKGSWRPTNDYEVILMLTKTNSYYADKESVTVSQSPLTLERFRVKPTFTTEKPYHKASRRDNYKGFRSYTPNAILLNGRNLRSVWSINSEASPTFRKDGKKLEHFATFPGELPKRCIMASTPEVGVCKECGAPYARVVQTSKGDITEAMRIAGCDVNGYYSGQDRADYREALAQSPSNTKRRILNSMSEITKTLGWRKTCQCQTDEKVGALVLDPFCGTGTTLAMAKRLGCRSVGYELSLDYCEMANQRIAKTPSPFPILH